MKTKDQLRAERANASVLALKPEVIEEYVAEVRELPVVVSQSGLGQALALLKAKGGVGKSALYDHLSGWIADTIYGEAKADLLSLVVAGQASRLMRAQEEALLLLGWLRRFAEAREPKTRKS